MLKPGDYTPLTPQVEEKLRKAIQICDEVQPCCEEITAQGFSFQDAINRLEACRKAAKMMIDALKQ